MPLLIVASPETREGPAWAALPAAVRSAPEGLGWFVKYAPIDSTLAHFTQAACVCVALLTMFGVYTRPALLVLTVTTFYLFALAQLGGTVTHDMHLVWFAAILAASPCDDALSYDTRRRGGSWLALERPPHEAYAWPLLMVWLSLGVIYFFPGFYKLRESGLDWALGSNLENQMHWKWRQYEWLPVWRIDHAPWLLHVSALLVIAFELSFGALALVGRRARVAIACAGLAFHVATDLFMRIPFISLWACYVALIDWSRVARWARAKTGAIDARPPSSPVAAIIVGAIVIASAAIQGVRDQTQAWPFACYPTFQWTVGDEMPDLAIVAVFGDGTTREVLRGRRRSQRAWGTMWSLAGVNGLFVPARVEAYYRDVVLADPEARTAVRGAVSIRIERVWLAVAPERWSEPPTRRERLLELKP